MAKDAKARLGRGLSALIGEREPLRSVDAEEGAVDAPAVVLYTHGVGCPIVRRSITELNRLEEEFSKQGVVFYMINANPGAKGYANYQTAGLKWIMDEFGYDGFYTDGTTNFPSDHNAAHGAGYIDENGNRRPTYTIFAVREAMKRLYRIAKDRRPHGINTHHSSFTLNIPLVSMGDIYYTGEHEDDETDPAQDAAELLSMVGLGCVVGVHTRLTPGS